MRKNAKLKKDNYGSIGRDKQMHNHPISRSMEYEFSE